MTVTGIAGVTTTGPACGDGIRMDPGSAITVLSGDFTLDGTSGDSTVSCSGIFAASGATLTMGPNPAQASTLTLLGTGGSGNADGVFSAATYVFQHTFTTLDVTGTGGGAGGAGVDFAGLITCTTAGVVSLHGTGGGSATSGDTGVSFTGGGNAFPAHYDLTLTGIGGGTGASRDSYGVSLDGRIDFDATVTVTGTGGQGSGLSNYGVYVANVQLNGLSNSDGITVTGTAGLGSQSHAVFMSDTDIVDVGATGSIDISQSGTALSGGVVLVSVLFDVSMGPITVTGTGGFSSGGSEAGVSISTSFLESANTITLDGTVQSLSRSPLY